MKQNKKTRLLIRASDEWKAKVEQAANRADTTVSQFVRESVNARIEREKPQAQAA